MKGLRLCTFSFMASMFFLLMSCGNANEVKIPDDILSKEKMAEVMVDIHLLEATMNMNIAATDKASPTAVDVFKKHDITKEQYQESFVFYTEHPEVFTEVYQLVLNDLSKMQAEVSNGK